MNITIDLENALQKFAYEWDNPYKYMSNTRTVNEQMADARQMLLNDTAAVIEKMIDSQVNCDHYYQAEQCDAFCGCNLLHLSCTKCGDYMLAKGWKGCNEDEDQ